MMIYPFDYRMDNIKISKDKHQRIALVITMIGAASLLSLGAVASTTITAAFAGGENDGGEGTEKNIDDLIIFNEGDKPLTQEQLLQLLTEQQASQEPSGQQPVKGLEGGSGVGTEGFSAPSLP
jgi:hypothetical protein